MQAPPNPSNRSQWSYGCVVMVVSFAFSGLLAITTCNICSHQCQQTSSAVSVLIKCRILSVLIWWAGTVILRDSSHQVVLHLEVDDTSVFFGCCFAKKQKSSESHWSSYSPSLVKKKRPWQSGFGQWLLRAPQRVSKAVFVFLDLVASRLLAGSSVVCTVHNISVHHFCNSAIAKCLCAVA